MNNTHLFYLQGKSAMVRGKYSTAINRLTRALPNAEDDACNPISIQACLNIGICFIELRKFDEAESYLKRGLRMTAGAEETYPEQYAEICVNLLYVIWRRSDDPNEGLEILEAALKMIDTFAERNIAAFGHLYGFLGAIKSQTGHSFEAEALLRTSLDISLKANKSNASCNELILDRLVTLLITQSRWCDAITALEMYSPGDRIEELHRLRALVERKNHADSFSG